MASYNLNEALKKKAAPKKAAQQEIKLDDVSRVKVLSPGRQVFKRFIRNRLAVFGTVLLLTMFVFSFIGPLFYAYGQKQIFYKYDAQNVNYALAKENTAYTGYVSDPAAEVDRGVASMMNTNIKKMEAEGLDRLMYLGGDEKFYALDRLGESIYTLSLCETEKVASFGGGEVRVGLLDSVGKKMEFDGETLGDAFIAAASKACKGKDGSFEYDGATYTFKKAAGKKFEIFGKSEGFVYEGEALAPEFEAAAETTPDGATFDFGDSEYAVSGQTVYRLGESAPAMVYTRFVLDTVNPGTTISNEFRCAALLNAYTTGKFTADGADYTIHADGDELFIRDAQGNDYAEFSSFVVRRYNGDDTMEYALKNQVREAIETMKAAGSLNASVTCALPQQNEVGEYAYGDDGSLLYNDTELKITQKDTGEYVINCDQIIYKIDMYASPSLQHLLGTDGDGFDVLARIMYGGRISLMVGFVVVFLECFLGIIMGGLAGYYGGWVDNLIMRLVDVFYCLPSMPIMIILGAMMDAMRMDTYVRLIVMMAALGLMGWAGVARLVRGQILSIKTNEYVLAARALGAHPGRIIRRHILPNCMSVIIISVALQIPSAIFTESFLSFIGLGVQAPMPSLGSLANAARGGMQSYPYKMIFPAIGICLIVLSFNLLGDGLRDAFDPKLRR